VLVVPEILGHRQRCVTHAEAAARRFVHLAEHHHHVWQDPGCLHFAIELLAFATAFTNAAEDADALVVRDHVVDHFGEQHGLPDAGSPEKARLAAALQWHQHVDQLDARLEDFRLRRASRQRRRCPVHGTPLHIHGRRLAVDGVAEHVEHARNDAFTHRSFQRPARVLHRHPARKTLRGGQRDPPHVTSIALRQHLDDDLPLVSSAQHRIDRRQMLFESDVHNASAYRDDRAGTRCTGLIVHGCS
jgi:hypothetical protein